MREKAKVPTPLGYWRRKLRRLIREYSGSQSSLERRASSFGRPIGEGNLSGFLNNSRPDGGDALSIDKIDQIARALGCRLDIVPEDSIIVDLKQVVSIVEAAAKKARLIVKQAKRDS